MQVDTAELQDEFHHLVAIIIVALSPYCRRAVNINIHIRYTNKYTIYK